MLKSSVELKGTAESGDDSLWGLSLLMTPFTLPMVMQSIVNKEQGCPKGACGHSWYKILINPPDVSRKRKKENLMMQYVKMKNKKELK